MNRFTHRITLLAIAASLAALVAPLAHADTLFAPNGSRWDIDNVTGYVDDGSEDAFDGYGQLGIRFGGTGDGTAIDGLGLTLSGRTHSTTTPVVVNGISTSRTIFSSTTGNYLRYLNTFTNTTAGNLTFEVASAFGGDLGSDTSTAIRATSSGDLSLGTNDTYVVSTQGTDATSSDPPVGMIFQSAGNSLLSRIGSSDNRIDPFVSPYLGDGDDGISFIYTISLAPGASITTAQFLFQGVPNSAPTDIVSETSGFNIETGFSDLTPAERGQIANFGAPVVVPESGTLALLLPVLGLAGVVVVRRRK